MNLIHRAGQNILVNEKEIRTFALADTASFILKEHLLCTVNGERCERLLPGQELFRPERGSVLTQIFRPLRQTLPQSDSDRK